MSERFKKFLTRSALGLIILLMAAFSIAWYQFAIARLPIAQQTTTRVLPNMSAKMVIQQLKAAGQIRYPQTALFFLEIRGVHHQLKVGEYLLTSNMSAKDLFENMITGRVYMRRFTIYEGMRFVDIRKKFQQNQYLQHTIDTLSDQQIMQKLGSAQQNPEGLLFPDTYFYTWNDPDWKIINLAYQKMQNSLNSAWPLRATSLPYTYHSAYEALIVASLIEKETANAEERPIIAGILLNRLQKNMRLQVDPTVPYGLGVPFSTPITKADLKQDTVYNTYTRNGLPPTPICSPSFASIFAALHPKITDYLYYVATGDGTHQFSATYAEQQLAVYKYRLRYPKRTGYDLLVVPFCFSSTGN